MASKDETDPLGLLKSVLDFLRYHFLCCYSRLMENGHVKNTCTYENNKKTSYVKT